MIALPMVSPTPIAEISNKIATAQTYGVFKAVHRPIILAVAAAKDLAKKATRGKGHFSVQAHGCGWCGVRNFRL